MEDLIKALEDIQKLYLNLSNDNRIYHNSKYGKNIFEIAEDAKKEIKTTKRTDLEKQFRQMVKNIDGDEAEKEIAGSVCEHYAIQFKLK